MKIRKMSMDEAAKVAGFLVKKYPGETFDEVKEHTEWHIKGFPEICLVAEEDGRIIGFVICHLHTGSLEIEELYVERGYEHAYRELINEVLRKIPRVDTVIIWMENFKELVNQLKL